jgi:hypothetical protein
MNSPSKSEILVFLHSASSKIVPVLGRSGDYESELTWSLAIGWANALKRRPPLVRSLARADSILHEADPADEIRELTIKIREDSEAQNESGLQKPSVRTPQSELASL